MVDSLEKDGTQGDGPAITEREEGTEEKPVPDIVIVDPAEDTRGCEEGREATLEVMSECFELELAMKVLLLFHSHLYVGNYRGGRPPVTERARPRGS